MRRLIRRARDSLFTIPITIIVVCIALAFLALHLDANLSDALENWPVLRTTDAGGQAIAATVAGATITVAALVFAITALSTQIATNLYSPRALGGFFDDPLQQTIIGLVVGTFTYSLLVLASPGQAVSSELETRPSLASTLAIILGVASAIGIVAYINHSLRQMQIDYVVRRIADGSMRAINRWLDIPDTETAPMAPTPQGASRAVRSEAGGWVVEIDVDQVLRALPSRSTARVDVRIGEAVSSGDRVLTIWPDPGEEWEGLASLRRSIVTGHERSLDLDPTFGIRQLIDIALRALSIGVNDPTTAGDVVHHLKTPVRTVLMSDPPPRVFPGPEDRAVFLSRMPSRAELVHAAFSEIRLVSGLQPYVLSALLEVLGELRSDLEDAGHDERRGIVDREIELTISMAKTGGLPESDVERILERSSLQSYLDEARPSG